MLEPLAAVRLPPGSRRLYFAAVCDLLVSRARSVRVVYTIVPSAYLKQHRVDDRVIKEKAVAAGLALALETARKYPW